MPSRLSDNPFFRHPITADHLAEFQEWERGAAQEMIARYHLIPSQVVFELRASDVPVRDPAVAIHSADGQTLLVHARTGERVEIRDVDGRTLAEALDAIDGASSLEQLRARCATSHEDFASLCRALLGTAITLPQAVGDLERRVPMVQLVRFPQQSPYALSRAYWENSIAIRDALEVLYDSTGSLADFLEALCGCHRLATVGENGRNYYGGGGGVATVPGGLRELEVFTIVGRPILRTLETWVAQLGLADALVRRGSIFSRGRREMVRIHDDGLRCVYGAGAGDRSPRTLLDEARDELRQALRARAASDVRTVVGACARFHQLFVAAHPFYNINHSLVMNVVNDCLAGVGAGSLPHLYLDYLAQRTSPPDYESAFARAVERYAIRCGDDESIEKAMGAASALLRIASLQMVAEFKTLQTSGPRPG